MDYTRPVLAAPAAPRPRRRLQRPCLICGLLPGSHGIAILSCRLMRTQRVGERVMGTTLLVGLCTRCLAEALRDGRVPASRKR